MPAIYKVSIASPMAGTSTPFGKRSFCKRSCTSYATSEHKQNLYRHSWPAQRAMCVPGGYCTLDPDAGAGCKCRCCCEDGPAPGPRLPARPSVGSGRPGRTEQPSRRASNGAVARSWRAMPRNSAVEKSRITFSMKIFLETAPVEAANSTTSRRSANAEGPGSRHAPSATTSAVTSS